MIRLLKKSEIDKSKADDRAREVAEGLKISRRVDSLRELRVNEESALEKWRQESLSAIQKEISDLDRRKESALSELKSLEEKAKKELSKTDKKRLEDFKNELDRKSGELLKRKQELDLIEIDIALSMKEAEDASARTKTHEMLSRELHEAAETERYEAQQRLLAAQTVENRARIFKEETNQEILLKENVLLSRGKDIALQEEENMRVSRELAAEKIQLADQRKTLERALKRLKDARLI